jgi:putative membrane protein
MQPVEMMSWYGMIFGPIIMLIWLVVLIVVAIAVIRWLQGGSVGSLPSFGGRKRAVEILEERFAKGEIDKDEFQEKKRLLSD